jgi:hypothetical protein
VPCVSAELYTQAWKTAWPQVRARMEASYWEEHYIEKALTSGQGDQHFKRFKMMLDGWDQG